MEGSAGEALEECLGIRGIIHVEQEPWSYNTRGLGQFLFEFQVCSYCLIFPNQEGMASIISLSHTQTHTQILTFLFSLVHSIQIVVTPPRSPTAAT